jgi:hypothetical protein
VDYGTGPMVRDVNSGNYRRTRLLVLRLGYSRKSVQLLVFRSVGAGVGRAARGGFSTSGRFDERFLEPTHGRSTSAGRLAACRCPSLRRGDGIPAFATFPGHDVAALPEKSSETATHINGRLSLLQLIPE